MAFIDNETQKLNENLSNSKEMLCWYAEFRNDKLPILTQYAKCCKPNDRQVIDILISKTNELGTELDLLCTKEAWQFLPVKHWNEIYGGLHLKIINIKDSYNKIKPQITAYEESLSCEM